MDKGEERYFGVFVPGFLSGFVTSLFTVFSPYFVSGPVFFSFLTSFFTSLFVSVSGACVFFIVFLETKKPVSLSCLSLSGLPLFVFSRSGFFPSNFSLFDLSLWNFFFSFGTSASFFMISFQAPVPLS
ncbi:hypothetical protein [Methanosarcina sp. KYL-1]|uniref:hypothetical protein n=1 Tax=Methanosarcina sp. KYL-1 TaxID=2602068 RepID=UPI00210132EE|nr:hypothetical protein [Methanosarcina sp. KYL-1]